MMFEKQEFYCEQRAEKNLPRTTRTRAMNNEQRTKNKE